MVYLLIAIGISLIVLGKVSQKKYRVDFKESEFIDEIYRENEKSMDKPKESKREPLEKRIEILEQMLFTKLLEEQKNEKALETGLVEEDREEDSYEKYLMIKKYERQKKSLDEIAKLLNINKGEVILLKNLYKNS